MQSTSPYDANNDFFRFNLEDSQASKSAFSLNYDPKVLTAYSANPSSSVPGGISPTGQANLTFAQQSTPNGTTSSATSITQPTITNFTPNVNNTFQSQQGQSQSSPVNSAAMQLFSTAGKQVLPGITSTINDFGAGIGFGSGTAAAIPGGLSAAETGFLTSAQTASGILPESVSGSLTSATLSGVLGAAGLGFLGGGILAGMLGENPTGGSIGGGIGAGIGFAVGGPVGALIGGIGGSLFGGMFGSHSTPTSASSIGGNLSATGLVNNDYNGSKNPSSASISAVTTSEKNFSSLAQAASQALGIDFSNVRFGANYSSQHGGNGIAVQNIKTGETTGYIPFDTKDPTASQGAFLKALQAAATASGYTDTKTLTDWYNTNYVSGTTQNGATNVPPSIPNNPHAQDQQNSWQQFLDNYRQQQNANAAPSPTTAS